VKIDGLKCHPNIVFLLSQADSADILIIFDSKNNMMKVRIGNDLVVEAAAKYDGAEFVEYYIGGVSSDVRERYEALIQRAVLPTSPLTC
jgi:hypothetical protein